MSPGKGPRRREGSPSGGASALITSAPREASSLPQYGPHTLSATSSTRSPARAWGGLFARSVSICYLASGRMKVHAHFPHFLGGFYHDAALRAILVTTTLHISRLFQV